MTFTPAPTPYTGPMPDLAAVVFDRDGTLFDSWQVVTDAFIATVIEAGGEPRTPNEVIVPYRFGLPRAIRDHLLARPCRDDELADYHRRLRRDAWSIRPYPGLPAALEQLSVRVPLALFTGADLESVDILLTATDLRRHFKVIVGGDEIEHPKPAPDGLLLACKRLAVEPNRAAHVGDSPMDLEAAQNAGMLAVAAAWGHLEAGGADIVIDRPDDLLQLTLA